MNDLDRNWNGDYVLKFEGEECLLGLWNLLMKAGLISGNKEFNDEADAIMKIGPELGFYQISEKTFQDAKKVVDNSY